MTIHKELENETYSCLMCYVLCRLKCSYNANIYFTRHGKTMFNIVHRVERWSGSPLTKAGIEVAEQLGRSLKGIGFSPFILVILGKSRETARITVKTNGKT